MASFINEENDCILVHTDAGFNVCLMALAGLSQADVLQYQSMQEVSIDHIESNNPHDVHRFVFGGQHAGKRERRIQAFAKTASSVLRMCMLRSANAGHCPVFGKKSHTRNRDKMNVQVHRVPGAPQFELSPTNSKMHIQEYYSYYDKMHPHFMIENKLLQRQPGERWFMEPTMMLVFRKNFSEVIEFGTNMDVTDMSGERDRYGGIHPPGTFTSYVNVRCIVRKITNPKHESLQFFRALCDPEGGAKHIFETYRKGLKMNLREHEPLPPYPPEAKEVLDEYEEPQDEEDRDFLAHSSPSVVTPSRIRPPSYNDPKQAKVERLSQQMVAMGLN